MNNQKAVIRFMDDFVEALSLSKTWQLFNPFFWFVDRNITEDCENQKILYKIYEGKKDIPDVFLSYMHSCRWLLKNVLQNIRFFILHGVNYLKGFNTSKTVFGDLKHDTDVVICTWLYRKDLENIQRGRAKLFDSVWGNLDEQIRQSRKKYQALALLMFEPTKEELMTMVENDIIVVNPIKRYSIMVAYKALISGLKTLTGAARYLKRPDWVLAYIASLFNITYLSAISIYEDISKLIKDKKCKVFMPWENQPKQKAICSAFSEKGLVVIGYIHALSNINIFLYKMPMMQYRNLYPKKIFIHGEEYFETMKQVGWNVDEMMLVRCQRYLNRDASEFRGNVYLPYSVNISRKSIPLIRNMINNKTCSVGEVLLHPCNKDNKKLKKESQSIPCNGGDSRTIVIGFSNIIMEALEAGCEVIQITIDGAGSFANDTYPSLKTKKINDNCYKITLPANRKGCLLNYESGISISSYIMNEVDDYN